MIKQKKAQEGLTWLKKVVLMAVVLVVLIIIVRLVLYESYGIVTRVACKNSLGMVERLRMTDGDLADNFGNVVTLNCATEYVTLKSEKKALNEEVKEHILDCWDLWGQRERLFDQETGTYCVICKSLTHNNNVQTPGLVQYLRNEKKGRYLKEIGGERLLASGADGYYDFYSFEAGKAVALIISFGRLEREQYLIFNPGKGTGLLFYPYDDVGNLDCYSFEGRTTGDTVSFENI